MSDQLIKLLIAGALLVHGLGHIGAIGALMFINLGHMDQATNTGGWLPARSWLFPALGAQPTTVVASIFWVLATVGFVAASMSFWGLLLPADTWRQIAVVSALVSMVGIVLFLGTWPPFNTLAALAVNIAVLVTQLWLYWPPYAMFGK